MSRQREGAAHDGIDQAPIRPDVPSGPADPDSDRDSPPPEGGAAGQGDEESQDAWWIASEGYRLTKAYREAGRQRPDLTDTEFRILASQAFPTLSGHWGTAPDEILAYVNAVRPPEAGRPRVVTWRRLRLEQALARLGESGIVAPTQAELAEACEPEITERTLRGWLTREPDLRELLPRLRRPR